MKLTKLLFGSAIAAAVVAVPPLLLVVAAWGTVVLVRRSRDAALVRQLHATAAHSAPLAARREANEQADAARAVLTDQLAARRARREAGEAHAEATRTRLSTEPVIGSRGRHAR